MRIYAERYGDKDKGESYITDRGVFLSMEEFLPYRAAGWRSTREIDAEADRILSVRARPNRVLEYFAPMLRAGESDREELHRRDAEKPVDTTAPTA